MLRRALKRGSQQVDPQDKFQELKSEKCLGLKSKPKKKRKGPREKGLEAVVFGNQDVADELNEVSTPKGKTKKSKKKVSVIEQRKPAWEDNDEKPTKPQKVLPVPNWANIDTKDDHTDNDSDVDDLLRQAGDVLVKSTTLPPGILEFEKQRNANAEDSFKHKIQNLEFHPSSKVILTAGTSHRLNLFQIDGVTNPKVQSIFFDDFPIHTAHFSSNGEEIIVGSDRKSFYYYDMIGGRIVNVPKIKALEGNSMSKFEVSPDGKYLLFQGRYGAMHLISAKSKEWITTLQMNGDVESMTFSKDGSKMYSFGNMATVFVWDMNTRSCVHSFIDEGCIRGKSLAVSPNDQFIACGSKSGIVNIYDAETCLLFANPKPLRSIMNLTTVCDKAKFNCTSEILALTSSETVKGVKLVHFPSMHVFSNFPKLNDKDIQIPKCLDFSPKGGYMAIGNHKGHALLYRLKHFAEY